MTNAPRRILAVLECGPSDDGVLGRAVEAALESGGYLTLVVVPPAQAPRFNPGPYCFPQVSRDELRAHAAGSWCVQPRSSRATSR